MTTDQHQCHWHAYERGWVCCGCPGKIRRRSAPPHNPAGARCTRRPAWAPTMSTVLVGDGAPAEAYAQLADLAGPEPAGDGGCE